MAETKVEMAITDTNKESNSSDDYTMDFNEESVSSEDAKAESLEVALTGELLKEGVWSCAICKVIFPLKDQLQLHMSVHYSKHYFPCAFCQMVCKYESSLDRHHAIHRNERLFQCEQCSKKFNAHRTLVKHMRIHTGEKPFVCSYCSKRFSRSDVLTSHLRTHTGDKPFACKNCDKKYPFKKNLVDHEKSNICKNLCQFCNQIFPSKEILKKHKKTHYNEGDFPCPYCNKICKTKQAVCQHVSVKHKKPKSESAPLILQAQLDLQKKINETPEKSESNPEVTQLRVKPLILMRSRFESKPKDAVTESEAGSSTNTEPKKPAETPKIYIIQPPSSSEVINQASGIKASNRISIVEVKNQTSTNISDKVELINQPAFICKFCNMKFQFEKGLASHERLHTRQYEHCTFCRQSFTSKLILEKHMKIHANEKIFPCTQCPMTYKRNEYLVRHIKNFHAEFSGNVKPPAVAATPKAEPPNVGDYECVPCGKKFNSLAALFAHGPTHDTAQNQTT